MAKGVDARVASAQALVSYLSARLETPVGVLIRQTLLRSLREAGVGSDLERRVEDVLSSGEAASYAPQGEDSVGTRDLANRSSQLLTELEGVIRQ